MKCPKCNCEMETGMSQPGTIIIWTNIKHHLSIHPRKDDVVLADNPMGGATASACICRNCEFVIVEYGK